MATAERRRNNVPETDNGWQRNILCRYFMANSCRAGDSCSFSHDRSISNKGTIPCKYFSQGTCAFGSNCRFSHNKNSSKGNSGSAPSLSSLDPQNRSGGSILGHHSSSAFDTSWANAPEFIPRSSLGSQYSAAATSSQGLERERKNWSDVAEFVPKPTVDDKKSWAFVVNPQVMSEVSVADAESQLCPFFMVGECRYSSNCSLIHGDPCELCGKPVLHPTHEKQRKHHVQSCMSQLEADMELAFAVARSKDKTCGICMEVVMDKPKSEARFGIMPSCNHCFCLSCLRKWRKEKQFENKIIRACPECRQTSDYICPSKYWIDTKEEKDALFASYKDALKRKECKYYNRGQGECPFGNKCFYRHVSAEGIDVDVGPPPCRSQRKNAEGESESPRQISLFQFLEERDGRIQILPFDLSDLLDLLSDSEDEW